MRIMTKVSAIPLLLALSLPVAAENLHFGSEVDANNVTQISTILAAPAQYVDQQVTIEGTILAVCEKRGCWMSIASDKRFQNLRIKVKDGDMVFPLSSKGDKALATGRLQQLDFDLDRTRQILAHQAEEAGEAFDPASVTEPMTMYQLVPTGVTILDQ